MPNGVAQALPEVVPVGARSRGFEPAPPPRPLVSERHLEAVAQYEQALQAVQRREFAGAVELLETILERHPEEKELHERVRLYLNVCRRQMVPPDATPRSRDERVYAATLAINAGSYDEGVEVLERTLDEHPDDDHVHYMLAVAHTLRRDPDAALSHLDRAIDLNRENRDLAWQDTDLDTLRQDARFRSVVDAPRGRRDRRTPSSR